MQQVDCYVDLEGEIQNLLGARGAADFLATLSGVCDHGTIDLLERALLWRASSRFVMDGDIGQLPYEVYGVMLSGPLGKKMRVEYEALPRIQNLWALVLAYQNRDSHRDQIEELKQAAASRRSGDLDIDRIFLEGRRDDLVGLDFRHLSGYVVSHLTSPEKRVWMVSVLKKLALRYSGVEGFSFSFLMAFSDYWEAAVESGSENLLGMWLPVLSTLYFSPNDAVSLKRLSDHLEQIPRQSRPPAGAARVTDEEVQFLERTLVGRTDGDLLELLNRWVLANKRPAEIQDALKVCLAEIIFELPHETWFSTLQVFNCLHAAHKYILASKNEIDRIEALYYSAFQVRRIAERNRPLTGIRPENFRAADDVGQLHYRLRLAIERRRHEEAYGLVKTLVKRFGMDQQLIDMLCLLASENGTDTYCWNHQPFVLNVIESLRLSRSSYRDRYLMSCIKFLCEVDRDPSLFNRIRNTQTVQPWDFDL